MLALPKNNKLLVQAGPLKVTVPVEEVRVVDGPATPTSARSRRGHNGFDDAAPALGGQAKSRGRFPSIDVRG